MVHTGSTSFFAANKGQTVRVSNNRSIFVASQDFVRKNPRAVSAMLAVLLRGQRQSADPARRDETIRIFSEFQKQDPAMNRAIWGDYVFNPAFDEAYVEDMERTAAFLESAGRIKKRDPRARLHLHRAARAYRPVAGEGARALEGMSAAADTVGIGFLGAGSIADYHLGGLAAAGGAAVRVIAARSRERASEVARRFGDPGGRDRLAGGARTGATSTRW